MRTWKEYERDRFGIVRTDSILAVRYEVREMECLFDIRPFPKGMHAAKFANDANN